MQRLLFPDAFDVEMEALAALANLDLGSARQRLAQARAVDPHLPNLDLLEEMVAFLDAFVGDRRSRAEAVAEAFRALPNACRSGRLRPWSAGRADEVLARFGLRSWDGVATFLDPGGRLPYGALLLVVGEIVRAHETLQRAVYGRHGGRADLWGYLGDACTTLDRPDPANEAYVCALVTGPWEVDMHRMQFAPLRDLAGALTVVRAREEALALLLAEAWLVGVLRIPRGNQWLEGRLPQMRASEAAGALSENARRARRFSLLLFADQSLPAKMVDLPAREDMQTLEPAIFDRYLARLREVEAAAVR